MAAPAPHIEPSSIDCGRILADAAGIQKYLPHRGAMALLTAIVAIDPIKHLVVGYKDVRADEWWAADHIPGRPLFPGALMVEAAAQLSSYDFQRRSGDPDKFVGFAGIDRARFRAPVEPPCRMILACRAIRVRRSLFLYRCQGFVEGRLVFETELSGMIV